MGASFRSSGTSLGPGGKPTLYMLCSESLNQCSHPEMTHSEEITYNTYQAIQSWL